ncbi:DUF4177 domain-containing protein [Micromonospora sp. NPDC049171]|uniref:DUF4177 domain-containing protein n=1 Tax=Micromonospora sp. NPDC049171 TaxID=3155770 RepID=UPI0033CBF89A
MPEYKVIWIHVNMSWTDGEVQDIPLATETINGYSREGWEFVSLVPGTNAQTYHGVFVTLRRN